jgi:hypothetical protein
VRALADQLHAGCADATAYVNAVLHFFRHGGFVYSEDPGPSGPHALYNFLFKRKVGFCEHYASAFAILMRLENVPARIVAGYQGAQYNPYKNIYIVKQSNAHAWDEVWIEADKRWRRIDPTAIISSGESADAGAERRADDQRGEPPRDAAFRGLHARLDAAVVAGNAAAPAGGRGRLGRLDFFLQPADAIPVGAGARISRGAFHAGDGVPGRDRGERGGAAFRDAAASGDFADREFLRQVVPEHGATGKLVAQTRYGAEAPGASRDELKSLETAILESNAGQRDSKAVLR